MSGYNQVLRDLNEAGGTDISARGIRTPGEPQDPVRIVEGTEEMAGCIKRLYRILRDIETIRVPEPLKPMHKELRTFGRRILRQIDDFLDRVRDGLRTIQRVLEEEPFGPDDKAENIRKIEIDISFRLEPDYERLDKMFKSLRT